MIQATFKEWTLDTIDETFGTQEVRTLEPLSELLNFEYSMNDVEKAHLEEIRDWCRYASDGWNNAEVRSKIISRMIMLSSISNENFQYFLDRVFGECTKFCVNAPHPTLSQREKPPE